MFQSKMSVKIATINLCLGLKNKKDLVKIALLEHNIDILCMQETEIPADFDEELIQIPGFELELEVNATKQRVGMYFFFGGGLFVFLSYIFLSRAIVIILV